MTDTISEEGHALTGDNVPGQNVPEPGMPGSHAPVPGAPVPAAPEPGAPEPGAPEPIVPGFGTPEPIVPGFGTPEPSFEEVSVPEPKAPEADVPDTDVWSWSQDQNPTLDSLRSVKTAVLGHPGLRDRLDGHLGALGESPDDPQVAGIARWILGEYHRAWPLLEKVKTPGPAVTFAKGECCLRTSVKSDDARAMRRPDVAAGILEKHPDLQTDTAIYSTWLEALTTDARMEEVGAALKSAPATFKSTANHAYFEGRIAEFEGEYEAAEGHYKRALEVDEDCRPALFRLAFQYDLGGDDDDALEIYQKLSTLDPLDVHATINLGVLFEDRGQFQDAIGCYRTVLRQYPSHPRATAYLRDATGSLNMVFDEDIERRNDKRNRLLRIPINDFELSVRARNCLAKMKIDSLGSLVQKTEAELLAYKNFGETSLSEIKILLESRGLRLGMNLDEDPVPMHPSVPAAPKVAPPIALPEGVDPAIVNLVLADMELSVRCRKALAMIKAVTIGDLLSNDESSLMSLKNFGTTSLNELKTRLSEYGLSLRP